MIYFIKKSNRWKHLLGGILIGLGADDWYCAIYAGTGVAGAMEMKDHLWGGSADWIDFTMTVIGAVIGQAGRKFVL